MMAVEGHVGSSPLSKEEGFSVLEAIVAVALLAIAFLPLLELQSGFISGLRGVERADTRIAARQAALIFVDITNFDAQPSGEMSFGEYDLKWSTKPIMGPELMRGAEGFPANYHVTLYEVELQIGVKPSSPQHYTLRGLGWTKLSQIIDEF